jgi:hypothetical protein
VPHNQPTARASELAYVLAADPRQSSTLRGQKKSLELRQEVSMVNLNKRFCWLLVVLFLGYANVDYVKSETNKEGMMTMVLTYTA